MATKCIDPFYNKEHKRPAIKKTNQVLHLEVTKSGQNKAKLGGLTKKPNLFQLQQILERMILWGQQTPSHSSNDTLLASYQSSFVTQQGNIIWGGALSLAFGDFKSQFLKGDSLRLVKPSMQILPTLYSLNSVPFTRKNICQNSVYIRSGLGRETAKQINKQVKEKFPLKTTPALSENMQDTDFISYAYLNKALVYEHQFQRQPGILWFGKGNIKEGFNQNKERNPYMVEAFAAKSKECLRQIKIIEYEGRNQFFVGFRAKAVEIVDDASLQKKDQEQRRQLNLFKRTWNLMLSFFNKKLIKQLFNDGRDPDVIYIISAKQQSQPQESVAQIIQRVQKAQQQQPIDQRPSNPNLVQFVMPVIDLDANHQFEQLKKFQIQNRQLQGKRLKIVENIKLRMDEKGVLLQNDAFLGKDECAIVGNIQINIQNPFWLILTEQGKHPYLVAKINYLPQKKFAYGQGNYY